MNRARYRIPSRQFAMTVVAVAFAGGCGRMKSAAELSGAGGATAIQTGQGGARVDAATGPGGSLGDCTSPPAASALVGWAAVPGSGVTTTTGGGDTAPVTVTTLEAFTAAVGRKNAAVVYLRGSIAGVAGDTVSVGSNKTIVGLCGAQFTGHLEMSKSVNVIIRNLRIVGFNCMDSPTDCSSGADAITVVDGAHHIWFDHDDISDGSDGNLDITHGSDFVTVSWTKFHYSGRRPGDHQLCNLIGHDDANAAQDTGHLNVTFNDVWWADNVNQRMPRVRFGQVHIYNSLYTANGDSACIEVGVGCNILSENNVFQGVRNTVDITHADAASILQSIGNLGSNNTNIGAPVFIPPYPYNLDPATSVAATVMAGAGPR